MERSQGEEVLRERLATLGRQIDAADRRGAGHGEVYRLVRQEVEVLGKLAEVTGEDLVVQVIPGVTDGRS